VNGEHDSESVALVAEVPLCAKEEAKNGAQIVVGACKPEVPSEGALRSWMDCLVPVLNDMRCEVT